MKILEREKEIPGLNPTVEFNIVHTTFGSSNKGRWFIINRSIYFKYERDYLWFRLQYP